MPNSTKNFVTTLAKTNSPVNEPTPIAPPGGRRISFDPGAIFAEPSTKQTPIDYVAQGIGFNVKYAPLFVVLAILAYGLAMKTGKDFWFGTVLFGALSVVGYWALGFMENVFEPTSGHVIRSFFGYLVLRADIASSERVQAMYYHVEKLRQENERIDKELIQQQISSQIERHSAPQSEMNLLTSYTEDFDEESEVSTAPAYTIDLKDLKSPVDEARRQLLHFIGDLYTVENDEFVCIKPDGSLRKGIVAPWADSSDLSTTIKRRMLDIIKQTEPKLFYQEGTRPWQLNIRAYPGAGDAVAALDRTVTRSV